VFDVVDRNGQPWIQARQLGQALGYSRPDAVLNIYERNKDEFLPTMTATIEMMVGITPVDVRIFSLRGCHLLAMFARTSVAKAFRVWVLDVLETLNKPKRGRTALESNVRLPDATAEYLITNRCEDMRRIMRELQSSSRGLWCIVNNYTHAVQFERGVYNSPRHSLLCALQRTCEKAFTALSQEADVVEQSVKAMRILAVDMR